MKKTLIASLLALASSSAFAATGNVSAIDSANNQFSVSYISTDVNYTETGNGILGTSTGTLDTESGYVGGYALSLGYTLDANYLRLKYSQNTGHTHYIGQLQSGGGYGSVVGSSGATMYDYSLRYGYGFDMNSLARLTPYLEIGHNEWDRGVNAGETYKHNYYGVGILGQYSPIDNLVLSANAMIGRTTDSHIDVVGSFSGSLGNSELYMYGINADYAISQKWHVNAGIDYTEYKYGMSALYPYGSGYTWEPDSKTKNTTYSIGVGYAF